VLDVRISDHVTPLVGALVDLLSDAPPDPFTPEWVAVPSIGMRRWLAQRLGAALGATGDGADGVSANVHLPFPAELRTRVLAADAAARGAEDDPWSTGRLVWAVLAALDRPDVAADPRLQPLTVRAEGATRAGRAASLADLVDRYLLHRPEMVRRWIRGDDVDAVGEPLPEHQRWQPALVRELRSHLGVPSPAERFDEVLERLRSGELAVDLPDRLFLFGMSTLPPDTGPLLGALAERRDVHGLLLTPSVAVARRVHDQARTASPRRRTGAVASLARRHVDTSGAAHHPILRSWGAPSRETAALLGAFRVRIEGVGDLGNQPRLGEEPAAVPAPTTVLGRLQVDLRGDVAVPAPGEPPVIAEDDRSLQVHSCTGAARQVEALRDALLHLLAAEEGLTEGDIAVLCPRIEELAPVIQAVLGPSADEVVEGDPAGPDASRAPRLRYRITDRSTRSEVPLLGALGALVDLLPGRFTASEVADFLGLGPVRDRFRLSTEDLGRLDEWIEEANIRWGLDGAHRSRWGLPADFDANSWAAGLDRLLVSTAVRPDGATLAVGGVAPLQVGDGAVVGAARVADAVRTLDDVRRRVQGTRTIEEWCDLLAEAVEQVCSLPPSESWQRRRLDRVLADLLTSSQHLPAPSPEEGLLAGIAAPDAAPSTVRLSLADVRRLLADRLQGDPARAAFGTGAITFCSLSPLRSVPHRVVCVLGLDQDALPRGTASGDDLLAAAPALGDRDPRAEARQLLLEAVLSAQQALIITCGGADVRTNAVIPPAVVLDELWDCLAATYGTTPEAVRDRLQIDHPRQPFDERNFRAGALGGVGAVPWSFDPTALHGAVARSQRDLDPSPPVLLSDPLPAAAPEPAVRSLDELGAFLRKPVGTFMSRRLQLRLPEVADVPSDDLPVHLDPLEGWRVGAALMEADQRGGSTQEAGEMLRAAGALPPGSLGTKRLHEADAEVASFAAVADELGVDLLPADVLPVDAPLPDGSVLRGAVEVQRRVGSDPGPILVRFSRAKPHHVLLLATQLFALTVADPDEHWRAVSVHRGEKSGRPPTVHDLSVVGSTPDERADAAARALASLVELWDLGARLPLPLFDRTSCELAFRSWTEAGGRWDGDMFAESADPAARLAFGPRTVDELRALRVLGDDPRTWAQRLWEPVRAAVDDQGAEW
jgi:exodeoxyribonuclease V gamma subunit